MAVVVRYLIDTSAWSRLRHDAVAAALEPLIEAGLVGTCGTVECEVAWSTRSAEEYRNVRADRSLGYEWLPTLDQDWSRALAVQQQLWDRGSVRAVGFSDLLLSAVAERERVVVLHYDSDFDQVAAVTGQAMAWVVPRGTVP